MFEKILFVSSDLSANAVLPMQSIKALRQLGASEVLLLQCQPVFDIDETTIAYLGSQFEKALYNQKNALQEVGFKVEAKVIYGLTRAEAIRIARKENCSLIAACAVRQSWLGGLLYGNIAYEVIFSNDLPVLVIRLPDEEEKPSLNQHLLDHVLFPTDFSENAAAAFSVLKEMSGRCGKITLFHTQDKARFSPDKLANLDEFNEKDHARLTALREELVTAGAHDIDITLTIGSPIEEILHFVKDQAVSLVIMGCQGRGLLKDIFLGSVSQNVARNSLASVMLIPPAE